ncbi:MAG: SseB family protein [Fusobacterium polymorphum]
MMVNILKARFLVPVREVEVEGQTQMQMLMIKLGENGGSMIPVFTDNIEFDKMPNDETVKKTIIDAKSLINFPLTSECDGFLINPMGVSLPLNAGIINNLKNLYLLNMQ